MDQLAPDPWRFHSGLTLREIRAHDASQRAPGQAYGVFQGDPTARQPVAQHGRDGVLRVGVAIGYPSSCLRT